MIKLFAFDLDGTLLSPNQEIDQETLAFIRNLKDISYVLVTGRCYSLVEPIVKKYQLDCALILNSGHEYRDHMGICQKTYPFQKEKGTYWVKQFIEKGFHLSIHGGDGNKYIFTSLEDYYQEHLQLSATVRNKDISHLLKYPLFSREGYLKDTISLKNFDELEKIEILKLDARHLNKERYHTTLAQIQKDSSLEYSAYWDAYVDICDNSMDKGHLLLEIAEKQNILAEEIAAFGDSDNDISMLQKIPHSFAMGNAKDIVKKIATYTTSNNDEQGVLKGMKFILNQHNTR